MLLSNSRRAFYSAAVLSVMVVFAVAPVAMARPADNRGSAARAVVHLTPSQLKAVNGHQPVDRPVTPAAQRAAALPDDERVVSAGWAPSVFMLVSLAVLSFGAAALGIARRHASISRRRPKLSA
jgi:hypothetical protein